MSPSRRVNGLGLLIVLMLSMWRSEAGLGTHDTWVYIRNDIPGTDLTIHCKSKEDDLGEHVLAPGQDFRFHFHPRAFGNTLFFCGFRWGNNFQWYDIYREKRDYLRCDDCWWSVRATGPCLQNEDTKQFDLCDKWNPPDRVPGNA